MTKKIIFGKIAHLKTKRENIKNIWMNKGLEAAQKLKKISKNNYSKNIVLIFRP
jgi:hypothetical protein